MTKHEREAVNQAAGRSREPRTHTSQSHHHRNDTKTAEAARREPVRQSPRTK